MADLVKVLVVDDDRVWRAYLSEALREGYQVITASDGNEALQLARADHPDVILLDLEMPNKGGYEVCQALKLDPNTQLIPVIFLSNKSSLREKIVSFQLGAEDYLVKPGEPEFLCLKINRAFDLYREKLELERAVAEAKNVAFGALSNSADLGRSLRFAERTYTMNSYDKLAEGLFQTLSEFGLDTSVMFVTHQGPLFYAQNKLELTPLEQDMFKAIHNEGRFVDFGCRTFCNFNLVSLLIKNMPLDEPERYGQLKDTIPWILGAAEGKVGALDAHSRSLVEYDHMTQAIDELDLQLAKLANETDQKAANGGSPSTAQLAQEKLATLRQHHIQLAEVMAGNLLGKTGNELATNEIFSSDVDFF